MVGIVVIIILLWPKQPPELVIEGADGTWNLSLSPMPKSLTATPRPLIEYPNAASTRSLSKAPSELEQAASKVLPRPLIEYSNNVLSSALEGPPESFVADPRPLIEYSNSAAVFALEQLADIDFSHVQPRPLVEFADGGWTLSLNAPLELLQK